MAHSRASAEIHSLALVRMAEHEVRVEAQRLRDEAAEAARMATSARTEAETIKALSDARLHQTERAAEAAIAEKSAQLTREAEEAYRQRVEQCEREMNEGRQRFREDLERNELRKRTQAEAQEQAVLNAQARLRDKLGSSKPVVRPNARRL